MPERGTARRVAAVVTTTNRTPQTCQVPSRAAPLAGCGVRSTPREPTGLVGGETCASGLGGARCAEPTPHPPGQTCAPAWDAPASPADVGAAAAMLAHAVPSVDGATGCHTLEAGGADRPTVAGPADRPTVAAALWLRGRRHERPPEGWCDGLSALEWRNWLAAADVASRRHDTPRGTPPSGAVGAEAPASTSEPDAWVWTPGDGWRPPAARSAALPSLLDVIGTSRQTTVIAGEMAGHLLPTLEAYAAKSAAARAVLADAFAVRARHAARRVLTDPSHEGRQAARRAVQWNRGRERGMRERWRTVAECGTRRAYVATCTGCDTAREPTPLRCGLPRECPKCRGAELATRHERILSQIEAAETLAAEPMRRHGPTIAHPLGPYDWRFVSLTIPPGAGVARDARDVRAAFAKLQRYVREWCAKEGHETIPPVFLSAVEATPGVDRYGHVHLHVLLLSPYIPQALLAHWWGKALEETRRGVRPMPLVPPDRFESTIHHAPTRRLLTHTMRGRCGRRRMAIYRPIVDIRAANANAISELAKYAVKGFSVEDDSAWLDCVIALHGVRLYASSRAIASLIAYEPPMERAHCEACGVVGEWEHSTQRQRGPPEGARVYECRAILGLA